MGLLGSGIPLAEVRFFLTAQVRLRELEDEEIPESKTPDLLKIWRSAAGEIEHTKRKRDFIYHTLRGRSGHVKVAFRW